MSVLIMLILVVMMILLSVAFLTLMERKILSHVNMRKGPNKVGFIGGMQPFGDAVKLVGKEGGVLTKVMYMYYFFSPFLMLLLILLMWMIYPFIVGLMNMDLGVLFLMSCLSLSIYGLVMSGWSSGSVYAMLGAVRGVSQAISYEVSLTIIMLILVMVNGSFNMLDFYYNQLNFWYMIFLMPLMVVFLISMVAELNRIPFDFSEGESELVSGFNVEYSGGGFILIFLSEYASVLFVSFLFVMMFMGGNFMEKLFYLKLAGVVFMVLCLRGVLPRFRYDLLMFFCWKVILPFVLNYFLIILTLKMLIN